jgi:hypothetical protein
MTWWETDVGGVHGALAADLVEQWRDLGPTLWLVAAGLAAAWCALLALLAAATNPREVKPGPETLDLGGPESPAVVSLLANDWRLGHQSLPATLLDLAARKRLAIDQAGERTFVRVLSAPPRDERSSDAQLTTYERMVLDHLRAQAEQTSDGAIPAEALTTGPDDQSKRWWKRFRGAVVADARARGLSRPRWNGGTRIALAFGALIVAGALGLAATTLPDDPDDPDDDPIGAGIAVAVMSWGAMLAVVEAMAAERDTKQGRAVAARWLGLRELLAEDHLFGEQPPAGVAIWDRHIAYGAALGVARGAVSRLPLGAESDNEAWSPVGGRWRVVRIRYPEKFPPGYGRHPFPVFALGVAQAAAGFYILRHAPGAADWVRDVGTDMSGEALPEGVSTGIDVGLGVIMAISGAVLLRGAWMVLYGFSDLVTGRQDVEGLVLRHRGLHLAVDDGTGNRIRAWKMKEAVSPAQGATARARVSPRLRHVRDLQVTHPTMSDAARAAAAAAVPASVEAALTLDLSRIEQASHGIFGAFEAFGASAGAGQHVPHPPPGPPSAPPPVPPDASGTNLTPDERNG